MVDANYYSAMVAALAKPGKDILITLTPEKADLWHHATGVSGEAGELLDAVKRNVIYDKVINRENVVEELGDLEFYMEGVRQNLNITRQETLEANVDKLKVRYAEFCYTDKAANDRADKS